MPHVSLKHGLTALIVSLALFGCSDPNNQSYFNPDTGKHTDNWLPAGHMTAANTDVTTCAECHGADFAGGIAQIACGLCHMGGATSIHPAGWLRDACFNHGVYALNNGTSACANVYCHGPDLSGVTGSGPSCTKCHAMPHTANCGSCHAIPPATGRHTAHMATGLSIVCGSCHAAECETHNNGVKNVTIASAFTAKSAGTVTFNGTTCSKVSCHGGQLTPSWTAGTINVNTQCTACHAEGTAEYNSYNSGQHHRHIVNEGLACTACHDTTLLAAGHFTALNTPAMEGPAWKTIKTSIQYNGTRCANPCHDPENWR
jgi:predicted CxxxxCH...CXXCH cytochrome family protein